MTILQELRKFVEERPIQTMAAALLFVALGDWPYSYYTFLRIAVTVAAVILGVNAHAANRPYWASAMIGIVILFNPFFPIHLHRSDWAIFDPAVAVVFLLRPPINAQPDSEN